MSKFFQALENAEKERAVAEAAETVATTTVGAPESEPIPADLASPPAAAADATMSPASAGRATVAAPELPAAPAPPTPTYGAPVARPKRNGRGHADVFTSGVPAPGTTEAGQLDDHLVSLLEPTSFAAEQYRAVRLAIENFHRERGLQVVAISSPGRGEGKTISAINLAGALAQSSDARVVLVEADLRHPRVARYLGLAAPRGLSAYLIDPALDVETVIERPSSIAFAVVPAGAPSSMPYELLKSPRLTALFATLRERFDFVVVDTPPILTVPDVGILRDVVDGFVLVVRANRTPREGLVDGLDTIGRHRVLGLVFNDDERHVSLTNDNEPEQGWRRYVSFRLGGASID